MRVAITGGIADGKTTVCALLAEQGLVTVSADEIVAKLYRNPTIVKRIRASFGDGLMVDGGVSRELLQAIVSDSAEARAKLNAIFHPAVMREILLQTDTDDIAFAEVPLLIETATQGWFDEVWVVTAGAGEQRKRLVKRLGSESEADRLLTTQLPTEAKIPFADRVIRTNVPVETVKSTIARHVKELLGQR